MWRHHYEHPTDLTPAALWPVLADIAGWPAIDRNIDTLELASPPAKGSRFTLKPRGGPPLRFEVSEWEPPHLYADTCHMPGASMKTIHRLVGAESARIEIDIEIRGWLAPLWGWLVGRRHAAGLPAQSERFVAAARARRDGS